MWIQRDRGITCVASSQRYRYLFCCFDYGQSASFFADGGRLTVSAIDGIYEFELSHEQELTRECSMA